MKTKVCGRCKKRKLLSKFYKHKRRKDGLTWACKECSNKWNRKYQQLPKYKLFKRNSALKCLYGLTPEQHLQMYVDQDGCCAVCKKAIPYSEIQTDHNHKTGKIRGLLCFPCNVNLRSIDDKEFLQKALKYLKKYDSSLTS